MRLSKLFRSDPSADPLAEKTTVTVHKTKTITDTTVR